MHLTVEGKAVFHAEKSPGRESRPPHHGFRGWVERKAQSVKTAWAQADRGATGKVRLFWEKLQSRMPDDESMLARLRTASAIDIYHPATLTDEEAQTIWIEYLARCRRRHLPWLAVNTLLSPVSLLLAPIPGPNLIGYWFVYRAVKDLLAHSGLRHAQDPRVTTTYHTREFAAIASPSGEFIRMIETEASSFRVMVPGGSSLS